MSYHKTKVQSENNNFNKSKKMGKVNEWFTCYRVHKICCMYNVKPAIAFIQHLITSFQT